MAPIGKLLVAHGLTGENSQEKIVYRRKWLVGDNSYKQIARRSTPRNGVIPALGIVKFSFLLYQ
jgi:hypothetical protein